MLELMRRKVRSPFIQAMLVIIILVFVFWGVGTNQGGSGDVAATVNDQTISVREFQQNYNQLANKYRDQFGGQVPPGLFEALGIKEMALEQLIEQRLVRQGAREMGLAVSADEVQQAIHEMEVFRTARGFDLDRYREVLTASRMPISDFEASIKEDLLTQKVLTLLNGFTRVSDLEVQERFLHEFEELKLEYLALPTHLFTDRVEINDERLTAYFEKNKTRYQTAPQLKVQYLSFPLAQGAGEAEITAEEIEAHYWQNIDQYRVKERRRARHILIQTSEADSAAELADKRQQAEEILARTRAGEDFAELAKKHSRDGSAASGGDLGFFERGQMVRPFEEAAFRLAAGEISGVVETSFGYHLIKMEQIEPAHTRSLEEAKAEIAFSLERLERGTAALGKANRAYEQIILSGSLKKYAEQAGVVLQETDYFTRQKPPAELAADRAYLEAAFNLRAGELSSLITGDQGYAIIFAEDVKEPEIPALAEVREEVQKNFIAESSSDLARATAQDILAAARQGADLASQARELGLSVQTTGFLTRRQPENPGLPSAVLQEGLALSEARPYPAEVVESGRTFYVFRLKEKREPAVELLAAQEEELRQMLLLQNQQALLNGWLENLKQQAKITRNERLLM
jgi:peptidyl-prolyl cis-trans isomerase D